MCQPLMKRKPNIPFLAEPVAELCGTVRCGLDYPMSVLYNTNENTMANIVYLIHK